MKVGVPREVKNNEFRVAITPAGVHELVRHGHEVFIEREAGVGSAIPDDDVRRRRRADPRRPPTTCGARADMVLKVKEPIAEEYHRMRKDQVLFTYLHLAADKACTDALLAAGTTGIAYETVQLPDSSLPLLAPMSEVAGRLAPQVGSYHLMRQGGGRGTLMGGVPGVYAAKVVVIGAGVSGQNAAAIALGMQAEVLLLDKNVARLRQMDAIYQGHCQTDRLERLRGRAGRARRRPGHRRRAHPGRQGADAHQQRAGVADEAGLGARRHLDRPGRLLRGLAARPRTPSRPTGCTTRSSTAWPTCPARCRTPRPTR